jgi:hypothetical protein
MMNGGVGRRHRSSSGNIEFVNLSPRDQTLSRVGAVEHRRLARANFVFLNKIVTFDVSHLKGCISLHFEPDSEFLAKSNS